MQKSVSTYFTFNDVKRNQTISFLHGDTVRWVSSPAYLFAISLLIIIFIYPVRHFLLNHHHKWLNISEHTTWKLICVVCSTPLFKMSCTTTNQISHKFISHLCWNEVNIDKLDGSVLQSVERYIYAAQMNMFFNKSTHSCERSANKRNDREIIQENIIHSITFFTRKDSKDETWFLTEIYKWKCWHFFSNQKSLGIARTIFQRYHMG